LTATVGNVPTFWDKTKVYSDEYSITLQPNDGLGPDSEPYDGILWENITAQKDSTWTSSAIAQLVPFVGVGSVVVPVNAKGSTVTDGCSNLSTDFLCRASMTFYIVYEYTVTVVFGDPHYTLLDGMIATYVGCGDHILMEGTKSDSAGVMLQARHCLRGGQGSSTCGVALRCSSSSDVAEIHAIDRSDSHVRARIGGKDIVLSKTYATEGSDVSIKQTDTDIEVMCHSGLGAHITLREASNAFYFDFSVRLPSQLYGKTAGLLGSKDGDRENDISYRDGRIWNAGHGLEYVNAVEFPTLIEVQESWTARPDETLFSLTVMETQATCVVHTVRSLLASRMYDDGLHAEADKKCQDAGMSGIPLRLCIHDYVASEDEAFIRNMKIATARL